MNLVLVSWFSCLSSKHVRHPCPGNCSHWCSDGLGWTSLMLPWLSWTWLFWLRRFPTAYRGGTAYASVFCAGFLVLMAVIKTCETSIPKQLLSLMLWWLGLDVSHASMAIMTLVFYGLHLASPGKQTRPPLFCSIWYFSSATNDRYQNILNHDQVWGHIPFFLPMMQ